MSSVNVYCRNCGNALAPDDAFCPKCGAKQEAQSTASSSPTSHHVATSTQKERDKRFARHGCSGFIGVILILCLVGWAYNAITGGPAEEVELSGLIRLYGDASTSPAPGEGCAGTGEFSFIEEGGRVTIEPSGRDTLRANLSNARGGENQQCELAFGGTLQLAEKYEVTIGSLQDRVTVTCPSRLVTTYEFDHQDDIAFMKIDISDGTAECAYGG